jgi:hypothetical protein
MLAAIASVRGLRLYARNGVGFAGLEFLVEIIEVRSRRRR